jgi:hypothetical protein
MARARRFVLYPFVRFLRTRPARTQSIPGEQRPLYVDLPQAIFKGAPATSRSHGLSKVIVSVEFAFRGGQSICIPRADVAVGSFPSVLGVLPFVGFAPDNDVHTGALISGPKATFWQQSRLNRMQTAAPRGCGNSTTNSRPPCPRRGGSPARARESAAWRLR